MRRQDFAVWRRGRKSDDSLAFFLLSFDFANTSSYSTVSSVLSFPCLAFLHFSDFRFQYSAHDFWDMACEGTLMWIMVFHV